MSLLLLFAGAGVSTPPPSIIKVIGRAGGSDAGRGSVAPYATHSRALSGDATRGGATAGETSGEATAGSAGQGGVTSGEEP
jgi:hypothetical protein